MARANSEKQLYATATAIVDDKLINFPPAKIHFTKGGKPRGKGKKRRKPA